MIKYEFTLKKDVTNYMRKGERKLFACALNQDNTKRFQSHLRESEFKANCLFSFIVLRKMKLLKKFQMNFLRSVNEKISQDKCLVNVKCFQRAVNATSCFEFTSYNATNGIILSRFRMEYYVDFV